jgi:hypothetical protein|tara:strand:- start:447 stop:725 length:279 start_codon:yes stop_codon:yes gene_type:complete
MSKTYTGSIWYHGSTVMNVRIPYTFEIYQHNRRWHAKATVDHTGCTRKDKHDNLILKYDKVVDIPLNGNGISKAEKRLTARIIQDLNLASIL